jgi:uncharacterized repeat protein (TIGR03806 family)
MKTSILRHGLIRALPLRLIALTLIFLDLPQLLPAQTLQHRYSFTSDASDSVGGAAGTLIGNAFITNHTLTLPGGGTSASPQGYASLPNGIVSNDTSITIECWLTDNAGGVWAEAWCFGDSAAGPGQPPTSGTSYISLIPHSGGNDLRAAFNNNVSEIDVTGPAQTPLPLNVEEYVVVTYDAPSATAALYLNGVQQGVANVPADHAPSTYGNTFNDWFGRDEFGGDPMFAGSLDELRIWNGAVSPLYLAVSTSAGPNVLVTNLSPVSVNVAVGSTTMAGGNAQQATVSANFLQATNVPVTGAATNWSSSNTNVLTVNNAGLITAGSSGNATVSAMVGGKIGTSASITVSSSSAGSVTVGYWQFNNPTNLGIDSSGLGNNLTTASGSPTYSSAGKFGGALYVDGNSTMSTLSGAFPLNVPIGANPYTMAVWEKVDTGCPNNGGFFGWGANTTGEANDLRLNGPNSLVDYWYSDDFIVSGLAANPMDGNWHAIVVTWDGTTQTMYVDGVGVGTRTPAGPNIQSANFIVGKTTADVNFKGWMEDLLIANTALTPADIAVYQAGNWSASLSTYPLLPTASPSNTVYAGTTVTLSVLVAGTPPYQYQWQKNGTNISWGTAATLVLTNAMVTNSGNYGVIVGNTSGTNTSPALTVTVNPASAPIFVTQPAPASATNYVGGLVTFAATVNGTLPIQFQWQHNGSNIINANASSLTLASLQAAAAGSYTLVASNSLGVTNGSPAILTVLPPPNPSALNVLTYHNDNTRDGANTNEVLLTPANVNVSTFGRLITYPTDGYIYAQPLYVSGLVIPGQGTHNAVLVATENDTVYAFDADSNAGTNGGLLWQTNLGIAVSSYNGEFGTRYQGSYYGDIVPVVGITGTPVIDPASGTLYVDVHTREVGATTNYYHRIHALNITNGTERSYSPVVVSNSVPGKGVGSVNGVVTFSAIQENQRPGMTLANGMLYAAYGSFADTDPYHGWVIGFNATNLAQSSNYVFNTTPNATVAAFGANAGEGALWMGGNGLCVDASNNLYFATGNGSFSANTNGGDYADSFIRLSTTNGLKVTDYFTPYNQSALAVNDTDLGSGGTILLPASAGSAGHSQILLVGAGKDGTIRLVDCTNMGGFNSANDHDVQEVPGAIGGAWSTPAYFNNQIYYQGSGDVMKAFRITNGVITGTPTSQATTSFSALGGTPSISANGTNNGIVWTLQSDASGSSGPAILHAYNATNLALELYNSSQNLARDNPGGAIKMTTPTVVNGKVFVGAEYALSIFGNSLFLATPLIAPAGGLFTNSVAVTLSEATPNSTIYYTLDGTVPTTNSPVYAGPFVLTNTAIVQAIAAQAGAVNSAVASASFLNSSAIGTGTGLLGNYWANTSSSAFLASGFNTPPTLTRVDPTVNFNWSTTPPATNIGPDVYVVQWTGTVQPQFSGTYTFTTTTDDGVLLWVNGQLRVNKWVDQAPTTWSGTITLLAQQRYNIVMDYYQNGGGAQAQLFWSSLSTPNAIIPQTQLYPVTNPPPTVVLSLPAGGASYTAAASVSLSADADAPYNPITQVSFYANGVFLGTVSNAPYSLTTTGLAAGNYTLTATATDGSGLTGTSAPVAITVTAGSGLPYGLTTNATLAAFLNQNMPGSYNGAIPPLLSETGAFADTPNRIPAGGLIPYVPNTPLWSDNAVKSRYLALPNNGGPILPAQQIGFAPTGQWTFPSGTVFVKNFDLVVNQTNPSVPVRRLETRLLVRDTNGAVYGVTYKWRPDNSDADLLTGSLTEAIPVTNATGVFTQNWYYPSPADCLTCHTAVAGYVLGVNSRQLNGPNTYPATGVTDNQLRTLNRLGVLNPAFNEAAIASYEKLWSISNSGALLVERARSYLDANCAQCHQPGGTGITFDARYDTPLTNQNLINAAASFSLGYDHARVVAPSDVWRSVLYDRMNSVDPTIKMPPLARNLVDTNAVAVMAAWINSLGGIPALPPPSLTPPGGIFTGVVSVTAEEAATNDTLYYTLDGSLPTTNSIRYAGPILLTNSTTVNINAWAPGYTNSVADAAQFTIFPDIYFDSPGGFTNGIFQMSFAGPPGSNYVLQVSTDLVQWTSISTNTPMTSPFVLSDPGVPGTARFYRVLQVP